MSNVSSLVSNERVIPHDEDWQAVEDVIRSALERVLSREIKGLALVTIDDDHQINTDYIRLPGIYNTELLAAAYILLHNITEDLRIPS